MELVLLGLAGLGVGFLWFWNREKKETVPPAPIPPTPPTPPIPPGGGYIDGTVYESGVGGIGSVHIVADNMQSSASWETLTDSSGHYLLPNLPVPADGSLYLEIRYNKEGYSSQSVITTLNAIHPHRTESVTLTSTGGEPVPPVPPDGGEEGGDLYKRRIWERDPGRLLPTPTPGLPREVARDDEDDTPPADPKNGVIEGIVTGVSVDNVQIIIEKMPGPGQYNIGDTRCSWHSLYRCDSTSLDENGISNGWGWRLVEKNCPRCKEGDPTNWVAYTDVDGKFSVGGLPIVSSWKDLKYRVFYTIWVSKEGYQCSGDAPNQKSVALSISQPNANVSLKCKN